jgi:hypothetical protein
MTMWGSGARRRTRTIVRTGVTGAAALVLSYLLLAATVEAQAPQALPEKRSPLSEIAHDFTSWLKRSTGAGATHQRATTSSSLPLPRPRPVEQRPLPLASNKEPSQAPVPSTAATKNKAPPVLIND